MSKRGLGNYLLEYNPNLGQMKTIQKRVASWMIKLFNELTNHFYEDPIQEGFTPKTVLNNNSIPGLNDRITYTSYMMSGLYPMTSTRIEHSATLLISAVWSF
jgi:hypothetical protein